MNNISNWVTAPVPSINESAKSQASDHQNNLTKPQGSLGYLEEIAIQLAAIYGNIKPHINHPTMCVFAGDHGVVEENISLFPQEVTGQMILNFAHGGAAICTLCNAQEIKLEVINTGCVFDVPPLDNVRDEQIASMTANFCKTQAMSEQQLKDALLIGKNAAERAAKRGCNLFMAGEMGIGNTTSAAAISAAIIGGDARQFCGRGTGLDIEGVAHKVTIVEKALNRAQLSPNDSALNVLQELGGFEISAITGAYIRAAQLGMAILVDGFITTAAALAAVNLNKNVRDYMLFAHKSDEMAHQTQLEYLKAKPIYDLGMRLGEGSGAALATNTLKLALTLHNNMATFSEAGVSDG